MEMITKLEQIIEAACSRGKRRMAVAYAEDQHTLQAISAAVDRGIVEGILIGGREAIIKIAKENNIDPNKFTIIDEQGDIASVNRAVQMAHEGKVDIIMKGLVSTDKYMRGILNKEFGLVPPKATLSHITVVEVPDYHKLLIVADVAVIPAPDLNQKIQLTNYVIDCARTLGNKSPKVALIAPSEQMLAGIPSCVDAALIAKMADRGQIGVGAIIDGPLALDVAVDPETVKIKKLNSPVAGDADCLVFPNIESGNVFFKSATKFGRGKVAALVVGAKVPCVLTSRGDSEESKLMSIALASLSAK